MFSTDCMSTDKYGSEYELRGSIASYESQT